MKLGIVSDIHSNIDALESIFSHSEEERIDKWISLGDNIGYLYNPNEVMDFINRNFDYNLPGNHEDVAYGILTGNPIRYFDMNPLAFDLISLTSNILGDRNKERLVDQVNGKPMLSGEDLDLEESLSFTHARTDNPDNYRHAIKSLGDAKATCLKNEKVKTRYNFIGHSHKSQIYTFQQGICDGGHYLGNHEENLSDVGKALVVVPSAGLPRDGLDLISYAVFDTQNKNLKIIRIPFDFTDIMKRTIDYYKQFRR